MFGFGKTIVAPVADRHRSAAVRFLLCGNRRDALAVENAHAFEHMLAARRVRPDVWCARRLRSRRGAAMAMPNPGRTGFLFYSPLEAPGVDAGATGQTVSAACEQALEEGVWFVQALLREDGGRDARMLAEAGLQRLAELVYMRLDVRKAARPANDGALAFRNANEFGDGELAGLIDATHAGSLDCPLLRGQRPAEDVIRGHRGAGVCRPEWWWIAEREGEPAGCLLLNETADRTEAEVVYTGVVPAHRGHGVCAAMLRKAALAAGERGLPRITLAVDSTNEPALGVYRAEGFAEAYRRTAYVAFRPRGRGAGGEV